MKLEQQSAEDIIEEELEELDKKMRQLKVLYDQFFFGNLGQPPWLIRGQVDRLIRKFANTSIRSFSQRFKFNNLLIRYQAYTELWNRRMRMQEEGSRPGLAARNQHEFQEQLVARARVTDPRADPDGLKDIYKKFVAARSEHGGTKKSVSFDKFVRGVAKQAVQLQKSSGCDEIEVRLVVKKDQVQLIARPG